MPKSVTRLNIEGLVREGRVSYPEAIRRLREANGDVVTALLGILEEKQTIFPVEPTPEPKANSNAPTWRRGCPI